jgi:N-acetyl-anhydromuramyl-L-alanine amidase AmpD
MKNILIICILFIIPLTAQDKLPAVLHEEDRELYDVYFEQTAAEFGVPADLLRGISFSETRWTHMKWNEDDKFSNCTGMPRVYGVMGLWDNEYFGHSLKEAAKEIKVSVQELKESPLQNIRGAAALLKKYYDEIPKSSEFNAGSIESWQNAIAKFSGFPQEDLAGRRGLEIYSILSTGYQQDRISIKKRTIDLQKIQLLVKDLEVKAAANSKMLLPENAASTPDYPLAKWNAAYSGNFGMDLIQQKFVVLHDVEGSYLGCISWFKNAAAGVSSQFVLNSHPNGVSGTSPGSTPDAPVGEVTQMVEEKYRAWHVGCWNSYMIGIEHEGYASVSGWYTAGCYDASAKLVKYLCDKYNIPKDRNHVIAHQEWQNAAWKTWVTSTGQGFDPTCNTHTDPGIYWNWTTYMNLVTSADTVRPVVTSSLPQSNLNAFPAYKEIVVTFNTAMDVTSTNTAFSLTPNVAGTKIWSSDNKTLTFDPTALLPWSTTFTVKIDTSAKNVAKSRNLGTVPYSTSFTTVPIDTVGPAVIKSYPSVNETGVSSYTDVVLNIDEPVQTSSLSTTLKMVDENNLNVSLTNAKNEVVFDQGLISFIPANLQPKKTYTLKLLAGMKDLYNNVTKYDLLFQFTTSPEVFTAGLAVDNMEANTKGWLQPFQSSKTRLIDTAKTNWTFTNEKIRVGTGAAKLSYKFTSADSGVIEVKAGGFPPVDFYSTFGLWIAGDASGNRVELHFSPSDQILNIGKIYWRGWKFIQFPVSSLTGPNKILTSIVVVQDPGFINESKMYFDEIQVNATVTGVQEKSAGVPANYVLNQNYPNPFNPSTDISFSVPRTSMVLLRVFDLLGREISTLVHDVRAAGVYHVAFDASHLPSGVYYYSLQAGNSIQSRKMILLK